MSRSVTISNPMLWGFIGILYHLTKTILMRTHKNGGWVFPAWLTGKVFDSQFKDSGFVQHWILWAFCGNVLGQDISEHE